MVMPPVPEGSEFSAPWAEDPPAGQDSSWMAIHTDSDPQRAEAEDFIRAVYARRFGATVSLFAPTLVTLRDHTGILAAAGYRSAALEPLFLEHYLDAPAEKMLMASAHMPVSRHQLVEIAHLSACKSGEGRRLMLMLGAHLAELGFQWIAATITEQLYHLLLRLDFSPVVLGLADPRALGEQAALWGSYYDHRPVIIGGYLPQALRQIESHLSSSGIALHGHAA